MLWSVRHLWTSGACFVCNCYCHWSSLVLRNGNGTASFLHSNENVTQRDPLAMIAYSIRILPLIKNLKREIPDITQPWFADNSRDLGTFTRIDTYLNSQTNQGSGRGCYPKPSKFVLIMNIENPEAGKEFGARNEFKVCTCARYLGS